MAAVMKGHLAPHSLPVGMDKKMAGLQLINSHVQSCSSRAEEFSELSCLIAGGEEEGEEEGDEGGTEQDRDTDVEYDMVQREEAADMPPHLHSYSHGYGALSLSSAHSRKKRHRKRHRSHSRASADLHPQFSLSPHALRRHHEHYPLHDRHRRFYSTTALEQEYGTEYEHLIKNRMSRLIESDDDNEDRHSNTSSEEEDPPIIEMIYRRTCKDKTKLIVIPLLYFLFFVTAGVFAFYSIEALVVSYHHRVRTARYITVNEYKPAGIAIFPQDFATYENCDFKYGDNLLPHPGNLTPLVPPVDVSCNTSINVTFFSTLTKSNRTAMVFRGPTMVKLKQSLWLNFSVDTTKREFGAIEFLLLSRWNDLEDKSETERQSFLQSEEAKEPLYTVPSGFRSWIKMYYIVRRDSATQTNFSDFYINTDFSKFNDQRPIENRTSDPLVVLFEWKSPTYEYISDILSTTVWNTLGSLAGVFVTLIKAAEYFYAWIRRMRRERRKKLLKLLELQEERERVMAEYEKRKEEKRRQRQLAQSQEKLMVDAS